MVSMLLKKKLVPLFLFLLMAFSVTTKQAAAVTSVVQGRDMLFAQIEQLLAEVARLQTLLTQRQTINRDGVPKPSYIPYVPVLFSMEFESVYLVEKGRLVTTVPGKTVSATDAKLFTLFVATLGEENVATYVKEWRVFYKPKSDLGAVVEYIPAAEAWMIGVNREGFVAGDKEIVASFANLFIHEFAHILLFKKSDFETNFTEKFWTTADHTHAAKLEQISSTERFAILSHYYENNATRFVSDYATLKPSEDVSETFLAFVREEKPLGVSVQEQKIRSFYSDTDFVALRGVLRANLIAIGAL